MLSKRYNKRKTLTPEEEDKPMMIETLVFVILMALCLCGLVYMLVKIVLSFTQGVTITLPT